MPGSEMMADVDLDWLERVTAREAEVLEGIRRHRTNARLAEDLHLSIRTVESHVASLLRKSGAADRRELARALDDSGPPSTVGLREFGSSFVGRDDLLTEVPDHLARHRAVTLAGPGGIGKTRLAHEVVGRTRAVWDTAVVVDLLPVRPGGVAVAAAAALGAPERPRVAPHATVLAAIGTRRCLLVLDNAEHVLAEVADLAGRVHESCHRAVVLVTSREALRIAAEHVVVLPALTGAADHHAVRLFCDRAQVPATPDLEAVVGELEGIPLSIELAAARARSLGIDGLREGLRDRLALLAGGRGPDPRHHSATALVSWSYSLLPGEEARLLRALSRLTHEVDLGTAVAMHGGPTPATTVLLSELVEKSLLQARISSGGTRWAMLEVIRQFTSAAPLEDGERDQLERRLRSWAADRAQRAHAVPPEVLMPELPDLLAVAAATPPHPDQDAHDLVRSVAQTCLRAGRLRDTAECLVAASGRATTARTAVVDLMDAAAVSAARGTNEATHRLLRQACDRAGAAGDAIAESRALSSTVIAWYRYPLDLADSRTADPAAATELISRAGAGARGDPLGTALLEIARAWHQNEPAQADRAVVAAEATSDPTVIAGALDALVVCCVSEHRLHDAYTAARRRLSMLRNLPVATPRALEEAVDARHAAATTAFVTGRLGESLAVDQIGPALPVDVDDQALPRRVRAFTLQGRFSEAIDAAEEMWRGCVALGSPPRAWMSTAGATAVLALGMSEDPREAEWRGRALRLAGVDHPDDSPRLAAAIAYVDARLALHRGDLAGAEHLVRRCWTSFGDRLYEGFARGAGAELAVAACLPVAAELVRGLEYYASQSAWAEAVHLRCLARLEPGSRYGARALEAWERIGAQAELDYTNSLLTP